jgi:hypothetical protein
MDDAAVPSRHFCRKLVLGLAAGAISYVLLFWLHGPWEEIIAAALIGSVVGIADLSPARILVGSVASSAGWLLGSVLFSVWIEVGVGAWLIAGASLGAAFGACRRWWMAIPAMLLGLVAGLVAEASRYLTILVTPLRGLDMQLLLLMSAGLLLNFVAALMAPPFRRTNARS